MIHINQHYYLLCEVEIILDKLSFDSSYSDKEGITDYSIRGHTGLKTWNVEVFDHFK